MMATFHEALDASLASMYLCANDVQRDAFAGHFAAMQAANERFNLTRITDPFDAAVKLYADSVAVVAWARQRGVKVKHVIDVGSGAGFPAFPIAVLCPEWQVTALEATAKKASFLADVAAEIGVVNLRAQHGHSHHWQADRRFDLVCFKAVASMADCLDTARCLVAAGSWVVAFKSANISQQEIDDAAAACTRSGYQADAPFEYTLPLGDDVVRHRLYGFRAGRSTPHRRR